MCRVWSGDAIEIPSLFYKEIGGEESQCTCLVFIFYKISLANQPYFILFLCIHLQSVRIYVILAHSIWVQYIVFVIYHIICTSHIVCLYKTLYCTVSYTEYILIYRIFTLSFSLSQTQLNWIALNYGYPSRALKFMLSNFRTMHFSL